MRPLNLAYACPPRNCKRLICEISRWSETTNTLFECLSDPALRLVAPWFLHGCSMLPLCWHGAPMGHPACRYTGTGLVGRHSVQWKTSCCVQRYFVGVEILRRRHIPWTWSQRHQKSVRRGRAHRLLQAKDFAVSRRLAVRPVSRSPIRA